MLNLAKLGFLACVVCNRNVDVETVDDDDDDRSDAWLLGYVLPKRKYRRMIAAELCDHCWWDHAVEMRRMRWGRNGRGSPPSFHQNYLWAWVARALERRAKGVLTPHLAARADRGTRRMLRY